MKKINRLAIATLVLSTVFTPMQTMAATPEQPTKTVVLPTTPGKGLENGGNGAVSTPNSTPVVQVEQVTVRNNPAGLADKITVAGLEAGNVVRLYDAARKGNLLGEATVAVGATDATVLIEELGATGGTVYVTVQRAGQFESLAAEVTFGEELPRIMPVQLLSLNDLHGKIDQVYGNVGRIDYVAAHMKQREQTNSNTLLVHAGDMVGGSSPVSALFQDEPTVEIMEAMGFDVGTIGNHELDEGVDEMLRLINGGDHPRGTANYNGIDFPMVAANVVWKETGEKVLQPYVIKMIDETPVAFIGVVTRETLTMVVPAGIKDIDVTDETAAVNEAVAELKEQGIESIVVLSHMSASQNGEGATGAAADLANTVDDEVDVIFAAHNHQRVDAIVDNKLIVQANDYGKAFADVDLQIDRVTKEIVAKEAEIVDAVQATVTPDPVVGGILNKYEEMVAPILNQVIGYAPFGLTGKGGDSALGNLVAESMKYASGSDFAAINGSGIRGTVDVGDILWGELYNVLPFNNVLTTLEVKGADMFTILNNQISSGAADFSIAGFRYTFDSATGKVLDITLPDGTKIDKTRTYTLTVNNYMATSNGSKYVAMKTLGTNPTTGLEDLEALVQYVQSFNGSAITSKADGRIKAVSVSSDLGKVTIAEARAAGNGKTATIEGVVTSAPGVWGSYTFYLQDATGGLFIYGRTNMGLSAGDKVSLKGTITTYGGELQLSNPTLLSKSASVLPAPTVVTPAQVNQSTQGQLLKLEGAVISNIEKKNSYGTFQFVATIGGESVLVFVDNRSGVAYDQFVSQFTEGAVINVTGVSAVFNGVFQLKPTAATDLELIALP